MKTASQKVELLAPGGDIEAIKAAIVAGANAVYCGLNTFNARNRATNLSFDDLTGILRLAHQFNCNVFLTINVVILEQEISALFQFLNRLANTRIDGIIIQDLGVFNIVKKYYPGLKIHASTQLTTLNEGQIQFLNKIGASRVNLSRELNLDEIRTLTTLAHKHDMLTEVFVHGSLCIAYSGQCYSSSVSVGNSGNRGRCSQACRDEYETTATGNHFPLNLKDNSAYFDLPELMDAGVDSLKIEGRIKGAHYVYTVVDSWRNQINHFVETGHLQDDDSNLHKVFNRNFTNSFLKGDITKNMFIDNPRDDSVNHAIKKNNAVSVVHIEKVKKGLYEDRNALGVALEKKGKGLNITKRKLTVSFSGQANEPLRASIFIENGFDKDANEIVVDSESFLAVADKQTINQEDIKKRFKHINVDCVVDQFDFTRLGSDLYIPFKELSQIKRKVAFLLNDSNEVTAAVEAPKLSVHPKINKLPVLSILISEEKDIHLIHETNADVYFKLPESFKKDSSKYIDLLNDNPGLIPWFPAVLIGKDYLEAVKLLEQVQPKRIVSNNTGIAYQAYKKNIDWIAGPLLNSTNSYALLTLKEELNCGGAFISNEINRMQIKNIVRPENFKMLYSIYHPILMMISRQCFFQQTVGCKKPSIDDSCMLSCKKTTQITNLKGVSFTIDKQRGGYPCIYNNEQFLNIDIVNELSSLFDEFFIDLTVIGVDGKEKETECNKIQLIKHFERLLKGDKYSQNHLEKMLTESTNAQYIQGL